MRKRILILTFSIFSGLFSFSQAWTKEPPFHVIIDTDCGVDDFRALTILLTRPEIYVKGILISDGNVSPEDGYMKVKGLLKKTGLENVPVGKGMINTGMESEWREFNRQLTWGEVSEVLGPAYSSYELLSEILVQSTSKITLLCLGPLTNIAEFIDLKPDAISGIDRIIWYSENFVDKTGFNYRADTTSAEKVLNSGLRIDIISNTDQRGVSFDLSFLTSVLSHPEMATALISDFYRSNFIPGSRYDSQLKLMDELVVVYTMIPGLFDMITIPGNRFVRYARNFDAEAVAEVLDDIFHGRYSYETRVAFAGFPVSRELYNYDVRQMMEEAIIRHGKDEWEAAVITNEFHRHLGIYSIIGVKMGVYALEILEVERDMIRVKSYAGHDPPYSCLNDGLQVSTGATLGMGTISVSDAQEIRIAADFSFQEKSVEISLKPEYIDQVKADISKGIVMYGLVDDGYWKLIRRSALKYWLEWDRNVIFNVK